MIYSRKDLAAGNPASSHRGAAGPEGPRRTTSTERGGTDAAPSHADGKDEEAIAAVTGEMNLGYDVTSLDLETGVDSEEEIPPRKKSLRNQLYEPPMPLSNLLKSAAGTCLFCNQKAGILSREHPGCGRTYQADWQEMVRLAAARSHDFQANTSPDLPGRDSQEVIRGRLHRKPGPGRELEGMAHAMADGIISPDEEDRLKEFENQMALIPVPKGHPSCELNQYQSGMCTSRVLKTTERTLILQPQISSRSLLDLRRYLTIPVLGLLQLAPQPQTNETFGEQSWLFPPGYQMRWNVTGVW